MAKKGYAYFDKYGILHISESETTAAKLGGGKYIEVEINYNGGYPKTADGDSIIVYDRGKRTYIGGNERTGTLSELPTFLVPVVEELNK